MRQHMGPGGGVHEGALGLMMMAPLMVLGMLTVTALVAFVVLRRRERLLQWARPKQIATPSAPDAHLVAARGILAERLARGEISPEEYRERMIVLEV